MKAWFSYEKDGTFEKYFQHWKQVHLELASNGMLAYSDSKVINGDIHTKAYWDASCCNRCIYLYLLILISTTHTNLLILPLLDLAMNLFFLEFVLYCSHKRKLLRNAINVNIYM